MPDDDTLLPTTRKELVLALAYRLGFDERGKPHRMVQDCVAHIAAHTTLCT